MADDRFHATLCYFMLLSCACNAYMQPDVRYHAEQRAGVGNMMQLKSDPMSKRRVCARLRGTSGRYLDEPVGSAVHAYMREPAALHQLGQLRRGSGRQCSFLTQQCLMFDSPLSVTEQSSFTTAVPLPLYVEHSW